jgi:hypothetical protein
VAGRPTEFHLVDRWRVTLAPLEVFTLLAHPRHYGKWWGRGTMRCLRADPGEPAVGKRATLSVRGFLPYRLTMTTTSRVIERPTRLVADSDGDLVGVGEWVIAPQGDETVAVLDWRVSVTWRLERIVAPLLWPLLAANHRWTMRNGEAGMIRSGRAVIDGLGLRPPG